MEEIDRLGNGGIVIIDDMRWPAEFTKVQDRSGFKVRLVTTHRIEGHPLRPDDPREEVDGLLVHAPFDAVVPAKGLVPQAVLEKLIEDLWFDQIKPVVAQRG